MTVPPYAALEKATANGYTNIWLEAQAAYLASLV
jgi:hypothetical protein